MSTKNVSGADNHAGKAQANNGFNTRDVAYLFGVYLGDGCCSKFTKHSVFSLVSEDRDVVVKTLQIVNLLLHKTYPLNIISPNKKKLYRIRAWNKNLYNLLTSETKNKTRLPVFINEATNREFSSDFVAGLMDTDGYISCGVNEYGQQRFSLGFVNSGQWLDQFITLFHDLGVKIGKKTLKRKYRSIKEKNCYQININLRSFVEAGLYFNCLRKQQIL